MAKQAESLLFTFKPETLGKRSSVLPGSHQAVELLCVSVGTAASAELSPKTNGDLGETEEGRATQGAAAFVAAWNPTPGQKTLGDITWCTSWKRRGSRGEGAASSLTSSTLQNRTIVLSALADFPFKSGQESNQRGWLPSRGASPTGKITSSLLYTLCKSSQPQDRPRYPKIPLTDPKPGGGQSPEPAPCFAARMGYKSTKQSPALV